MARSLVYRVAVGFGFIVVLLGTTQVARGQCPEWDAGALHPGPNNNVSALLEFDDGTGPALHVGGSFTTADGTTANGIAKWDGTDWEPLIDVSTLGNGVIGEVLALAVLGDALYVGGSFSEAGGTAVDNIAKWDGSNWEALGSGLSAGVTVPTNLARVNALTVFDDALYAGGNFTTDGTDPVNHIAKWDPITGTWSAPGDGLTVLRMERNGFSGPTTGVFALTVFDDGGGPALYAGGFFSSSVAAPSTSLHHITKWDGASWEALEGGGVLSSFTELEAVLALIVHDDGTGVALYAGGSFAQVGEFNNVVLARNVARWDGSGWSALGDGALGPGRRFGESFVASLGVFVDGFGQPTLYAGGVFEDAGGFTRVLGNPVNNIAQWRGSDWFPLSTNGVSGTGGVAALTVFDDGSGPSLYVGGRFSTAGGITAENIARWSLTLAGNSDDFDDDGIFNEVDVQPCDPSAKFDDEPVGGTTAGTVLDLMGIPLEPATVDATISDVATPGGVRVDTTSSLVDIRINFVHTLACTLGTVIQAAGTIADYVCGSLTIDVLAGVVIVEYTLAEVDHEVVVVEGGIVKLVDTVDPISGDLLGVTATATGAEDTVSVDGQFLTPGETANVADVCDGEDNDDDGIIDDAFIKVHAAKHTTGPGATTVPLADILVAAYGLSAGSCAIAQDEDGNGLKWQEYPDIVANCTAEDSALTDADGVALLELPPGDYILISHFDSDGDGTLDEFIAVGARDLQCGETKTKRLKFLPGSNGGG